MEYILPKEKLIEYAKLYFKAKGFKKRQSLDKGYWRHFVFIFKAVIIPKKIIISVQVFISIGYHQIIWAMVIL